MAIVERQCRYTRLSHLRGVCRAYELGLERNPGLKATLERDFGLVSLAFNKHRGYLQGCRTRVRTNLVSYTVVIRAILTARGHRRLAERNLRWPETRIWKTKMDTAAGGMYKHLLLLDETLPGGRAFAANIIRRRWLLTRLRRKAAARAIQRNCRNWLTKPETADGKNGIVLRLLLRDCSDHSFPRRLFSRHHHHHLP